MADSDWPVTTETEGGGSDSDSDLSILSFDGDVLRSAIKGMAKDYEQRHKQSSRAGSEVGSNADTDSDIDDAVFEETRAKLEKTGLADRVAAETEAWKAKKGVKKSKKSDFESESTESEDDSGPPPNAAGSAPRFAEVPLPPDPDFIIPSMVQIKSIGDNLKEKEKAVCVAGQVVSPSEFYLTLASNFPADVDDYVENMTTTYTKWNAMPGNSKMLLLGHAPTIRPGDIVACINRGSTAPRNFQEIVRARIVSVTESFRDMPSKTTYKVFYIDLAEYSDNVPLADMYFLHENYADQPYWSIRCRLRVNKKYEAYHRYPEKWTTKHTDRLLDILRKTRLEVTFHNLVTQPDGQVVWEVSIKKTARGLPENLPQYWEEKGKKKRAR